MRCNYRFRFVSLAVLFFLFPMIIPAAGEKSAAPSYNRFKEAASGSYFYRVKLPPGYVLESAQRLQFRSEGVVIDLYSRGFAQGDAVYMEMYADEKIDKKLKVKKVIVDGQEIPVSSRSWGYRGLFAINPDSVPGEREIACSVSLGWSGRELSARFPVVKKEFPFKKKPLDLGKFSNVEYQQNPEIIEFIKECSLKKNEAFSRKSEDMLSERVSHPRDLHFITSPFWSKRRYLRYKIRGRKRVYLQSRTKVHAGLDLRGEEGSPLFVMADGEVALADKLFYEGNMLIIDHGNGIFTYYMHLQDHKVKKGDRVKAGDLVATVGSTGLSTASHLHVSCIIRGIQVDPLSLLSLPVRD